MKLQYRMSLIIMLFISMTLASINNYAGNLTQQRWQFDEALDALKHKNWLEFQELSTSLRDYPLYYYLRYKYLKPRLKEVNTFEIKAFLKDYGNTYFGDLLRGEWLEQLANKNDWKTFVQFYTPQKSVSLQCNYAWARIITRQNRTTAIQDAKKLWLVGKLQPEACDPIFEHLYQTRQIDKELIWKRIGLAMKKGKLSLARSLAKRLNPSDIIWEIQWETMHKKPAQTLTDFHSPDLPIVREIIQHGIKRLARKDLSAAESYWKKFQRNYSFSVQQIGEMQRDLALASVKHEHPLALKWLAAVNKKYLNDEVSKTRIKLALKQQNWYAVADFIGELPDKEKKSLRWRYWQARALEKIGKTSQAQKIYKSLAKERDYYGFLAADRIKAQYQMQHHPVSFTEADKTQLMKNSSLIAAYEFYKISKFSDNRDSILNARREWKYAIKHFKPQQQKIATVLASRWGWHDQAIITAAKIGYYDDLDVRFPLAFYRQLKLGSRMQAIDLAWVYGIVRQESIFRTGANSRVGARGLMQLMPATARLVARKIGMQLSSTAQLTDIQTNISLGTGYLQQMLEKFDGNHMLATAAYNAGPNRAERWLSGKSCMPADLWVAMIPFNETRNYVRRVLFYTRVYEYRLSRQRPHAMRVTLAPYEGHCRVRIAKEQPLKNPS
jgi:soluble lytic murein transglycosylase